MKLNSKHHRKNLSARQNTKAKNKRKARRKWLESTNRMYDLNTGRLIEHPKNIRPDWW